VTVGREADKVKPNGKKRMNLLAAHLPMPLHRIAAARVGRPFQVTGIHRRACICVVLRSPAIAAGECEMPLDPDIM
jgi:hypothetical protein